VWCATSAVPSDDLAKQISSRLFAGYGLDLVIGGFAVTDLAVFAVSGSVFGFPGANVTQR
jgi:hypothetical protein